MPGPGPQPPTTGPFFILLTVTAGSSEDAEELAQIFNKGSARALEAGAKSFVVGRKVSDNSITVFEV